MTDDASRSHFDGIAVLLGALALLLAIVTVAQSARNRTLQAEVTEGQAKLAKAQALANLDNSLVQLMAKTAADKDDRAIRDLLARNGVTFRAPPTPAPEPETAK